MMKWVSAALAAAIVLVSVAPASADSLRWRFRSYHPNTVDVKFFSQNRRHEWPGNGQVWSLRDYDVHDLNISCINGEKICFGAWVRGSGGQSYWGAGRDGRQGCSDCCYTCGAGDTPIRNLNQ